MEYAPKGTLHDVSSSSRQTRFMLVPREGCCIGVTIHTDALDHLHNYTDDAGNKKSFIHRNVRPETVLWGAYEQSQTERF